MVMPINKEKLALRSKVHQSMPEFKRPESWRYKRLETSWRKPKGVDTFLPTTVISIKTYPPGMNLVKNGGFGFN